MLTFQAPKNDNGLMLDPNCIIHVNLYFVVSYIHTKTSTKYTQKKKYSTVC